MSDISSDTDVMDSVEFGCTSDNCEDQPCVMLDGEWDDETGQFIVDSVESVDCPECGEEMSPTDGSSDWDQAI